MSRPRVVILGDEAEVTVISPHPNYNWIPSNIWVGVRLLKPDQVMFRLQPIYQRKDITFHQAKATVLHPEGRTGTPLPSSRPSPPKKAAWESCSKSLTTF